jgi:Tol biopolymer transport system component
MPLTTGSKVGTYEILSPIGAGGMGEVYRAKDTRLPREAAIKVSALKFSERFAREAHVIASLNHPNITTLYDVGPDYLVMELVDGPTLADRIKQGPLTLDEASNIARQIADALDYAHERGVVHRDLKPGNVKIRPDGVVKVLDFGLAKSGGMRAGALSDDSPTMTTPATGAGVVLGTPAYMSPEQAKGKEVDKRSDIWAFGCVFYEMLTGTAAYHGESSQETMASILRDEPDLTKVPAQARRLLKRCLEKDPQKRPRHIGDVMLLLDEPASGEYSPTTATVAPPVAGKKWLWPALAAGVLVFAGIGLVVWAPWHSPSSVGQAVRFEVGETDKMKFFYGGAMAVSPDGHWMVFPALGEDGVGRYWLRSLDTVEARALPGTETAFVPAAWTADSRYVLFTVTNNSQLKKVDIRGGPPQTLAQIDVTVPLLDGAASNKDGVIILATAQNQPVFRLAATGGTLIPVTALTEGETAHRWPQFLPDGRHFLYLRASADSNRAGVYVGSLDTKPEEQSLKRLLATNRQAYFAESPGSVPGHLIFLRETTLMAQPFDPIRMELSGEPVPIAEGVDSYPNNTYGLFSTSDSGTLVYRGGAGAKLAITGFDSNGHMMGGLSEPGEWANPAMSPDQTRIAAALGPVGARDIWILDVVRRATARFTFDPADDDNPLWSPDGKGLVFSSTRTGQRKLYTKPADGSSEERLVTDQPGVPTSWSQDGRFLLFGSGTPKTGADIWTLPDPGRSSGEDRAFAIVATQSDEFDGRLSPDGRWVAYTAAERGVGVHVRPFSPSKNAGEAGARWLVSTGSFSTVARWSPDGKRLFYLDLATFGLMAVEVDTSKGFQIGVPRRLFTAPAPVLGVGWNVAPDGKRFLFVTTPDGGRMAPFTVVMNWAASLKK